MTMWHRERKPLGKTLGGDAEKGEQNLGHIGRTTVEFERSGFEHKAREFFSRSVSNTMGLP